MAAHHERTKLLTVNVISCVFHHTLAHTQFPKHKKQRSEKKMISMFLKISNPSEKLDEKTKEKTLSWEAVKHAPPATCSRVFTMLMVRLSLEGRPFTIPPAGLLVGRDENTGSGR